MKNKGFTLIELLAVIIILGILMIIAIPSVTRYISDSRKSAYIDTANALINGARNMVNDSKLQMFDIDTTYYIDSECIKTEGANKSPYGEFEKAYVVVTYDGKGYDYYWTSIDEVGNGIKKITRIDKLNADDVESDLKITDITNTTGIDGRSQYMIIDKEHTNCGKGESINVTDIVSGETGTNPIEYPDGKDKSSVEIGDVVKITGEEFYVVKNDGNNLVLLARYNLKVGNIMNGDGTYQKSYSPSDEGYGLQCSQCKGIYYGQTRYGTVQFVSSYYWSGKVGPGLTYEGSYSHPDYPYVYDSNNLLYNYVENYKKEIQKRGVLVKEARIISYQELVSLGCVAYPSWNCNSAPAWVYETSYWVGSIYRETTGLLVYNNGQFNLANITPSDSPNGKSLGVRPVIVI